MVEAAGTPDGAFKLCLDGVGEMYDTTSDTTVEINEPIPLACN